MLFMHATIFNCDLNRWDTTHVTNMSDMFNGATLFNSNIDKYIKCIKYVLYVL